MARVSIITALYNHERYIAATIESVLAQTFADWELIIWDDGSLDNSLALAREAAARHPERIRVFTHPGGANRGQENTRNAALEKATGEFVCLLDSDDLYEPRKLELLVPCFERPRVGLAYGQVDILLEASGRRVPSGVTRGPQGNVFEALLLENFIGASATMFRMECVAQGLRFDSRFRTIGEYPLWLQIAHRWEVAYVPETVSAWRDHGGNLGYRLGARGKAEMVEFFESLLEAGEYPEYESQVRRALAAHRYVYASELHAALELGGMRRPLRAVLAEPRADAAVRAKAAALLVLSRLGPGANRALARAKRWVWERRHPELVVGIRDRDGR